MPNCFRSLTCVKFATIREGNTTGIRLKTTIDMVKKNTIQEIGVGLIFCDFAGSEVFSCDSFACFSCLFLNFLPKTSRVSGHCFKISSVIPKRNRFLDLTKSLYCNHGFEIVIA